MGLNSFAPKLGMANTLAQRIVCAIGSDAMQPRSKCTFVVEAVKSADRSGKRLLGGILCRLTILEQQEGDPVGVGPEADDQRLNRLRVTGLGRAHQPHLDQTRL